MLRVLENKKKKMEFPFFFFESVMLSMDISRPLSSHWKTGSLALSGSPPLVKSGKRTASSLGVFAYKKSPPSSTHPPGVEAFLSPLLAMGMSVVLRYRTPYFDVENAFVANYAPRWVNPYASREQMSGKEAGEQNLQIVDVSMPIKVFTKNDIKTGTKGGTTA